MLSLVPCLAAARPDDVVIVGAGVAGLTTAYRLVQSGVPGPSITLIEQRAASGGRVKNHAVRGFAGKHVEVGGTWIGSTQYRVAALARELGLSPDAGDFFHTYYNLAPPLGPSAFLTDDGEACAPRHGAWPTAGQPACTEVAPVPSDRQLALLRRLRGMAAHVGVASPWESSLARLDNVTVLEWLRSEGLADKELVGFLDQIVAIPLSTDISKISMLFYLFFESSCPSLSDAFFIGGAQDYRFTAGSERLPDLLRQNVSRAGVRFLWNTTVRHIANEPAGVRLVVGPTAGSIDRRESTLDASHAVVAMGTGDAARLEYSGITAMRQRLHADWVQEKGGLKFFLVYETAFWRPPFTSAPRNIPAFDIATNSLLFFDYSDQTGVPGILAGFFTSTSGTPKEREALLASTVCLGSNLAGMNQSCSHVGYYEQRWDLSHPRGGTSNIVQYMPPGVLTTAGAAWRAPIGRLHWAGSDTAQEWMGYIDGAVESGNRAATEVVQALLRDL
ncbi:hypothetical protein AB1Y20_006784 [Prymnesium parvum]|uniref:Amine oxidase n=1 Tax=Prymnesium parvum TaxID=97485 RepID=A0AB34J1C7_PRYPA